MFIWNRLICVLKFCCLRVDVPSCWGSSTKMFRTHDGAGWPYHILSPPSHISTVLKPKLPTVSPTVAIPWIYKKRANVLRVENKHHPKRLHQKQSWHLTKSEKRYRTSISPIRPGLLVSPAKLPKDLVWLGAWDVHRPLTFKVPSIENQAVVDDVPIKNGYFFNVHVGLPDGIPISWPN